MVDKKKYTLYSGGLKGAESTFGEAAEQWGIKEVAYTFAGNKIARDKNALLLSKDELKRGDISMELVSKMMNRTYYHTDKIRKVLQIIFHMVNNGHQVFVIGSIQPNNTVKGGTGWAVELAKLFNRPLSVYDQPQKQWFSWRENSWRKDAPKIIHETFVGTGTRELSEDGRQAIFRLFEETFGAS
jgi:hypothetical protein